MTSITPFSVLMSPAVSPIVVGLSAISVTLPLPSESGLSPFPKLLQAAEDLERGVDEAAILLAAAAETRPHIADIIEQILYQEAGEQTYRMAMLIITNAFVFQSAPRRHPGDGSGALPRPTSNGGRTT